MTDLDRRNAIAIKDIRDRFVTWRQGVVTSTSPLEVSIAGGSSVEALGINGDSYTVSDRVNVLVRGKDLLVIGRSSDDPGAGGLGPYQPLDSDLTAIAALSTTPFGRSLLTQANAAAALSTIGAAASSHTHAQSDVTGLVAALALLAPLASPAFTGNPTAPTQTANNNSTRLATTAYVDTADALKANLASPTFTGDPKAPTPSTSDNDTSVATTAYVKSNLSSYAPLASPTFTGDPKAPTASPGDADTSIANTAFVASEVGLAAAGFTVKPQADFATVAALDSYVGSGTGVLEASVNGDLLDALGLEAEHWDYALTAGWIHTPYAIARDSSGNIYVAAYQAAVGYHVVKFNSSGVYQSRFGSTGSGNGQFGGPCYGITVDSSGNIYVADSANYRIQKFNSSGTYQAQVGSAGTGNGQFSGVSPVGLACDSSGNVFATDYGNKRVQKFNSSLVYQSQFGSAGTGDGQFSGPGGIAVDASNNMYVLDSLSNPRVQKFSSAGSYISQFGTPGYGDGEFSVPTGIALDSSTNIYVVDSARHDVQKFNSSGTYQAKVGSYGTAHGQFNNPRGVAVDGSGNLFVADYGNNRTEKFTYVASAGISTGQSVLVKDQNFTGPHVDHGVFEITATGSASTKWELTRREDMDTSAEVPSGLLVNTGRRGPNIPGGMWYISTPDPITLDSTALTWEQFQPGGYPTPHQDSHLPGGTDALTTAAASTITGSNSEGSAASFARSDHDHAIAVDSWTEVSGGVGFQNSWVNTGGIYNTAGFYKDPFGVVHLKGRIQSGTAMNTTAFTLPAGYRPSKFVSVPCVSNNAFGQVVLGTGGEVNPASGSTTWVSLDGIKFRAA